MRALTPIGIVAALLLQMLPAFADDVITNIMSPIASYQYPDNFSSEVLSNGGIMSPLVSYQYYEWPGSGILNLQSSPTVSYYYQFLDAPVLNVIQTNRIPTIAETTPAYLSSTPTSPQLMSFHGGIFTANLVSVDPNQPTIVLTHGWIPINPLTGNPVFANGGPEGWPTDMALQLRVNGVTGNIVAWNWTNAATSTVLHPNQAGGLTPQQGTNLGVALLNTLGPNYSKPIHFIGHSFGALVNAYAANYLQGANFASEPVSPTPWPATNMLMTLFDEAEIGTDTNFSFDKYDIELLIGQTANPFASSYPYDHPLPKNFAWAENYISAVGLLHANAANFILTNEFPASAPDPISWLGEFGTFHFYPVQWYEDTIPTSNPTTGFGWSVLWSAGNSTFANAPSAGSVYLENFLSDLIPTNWNFGTNFLNARYQEYLNSFWSSPAQPDNDFVIANGPFSGQPTVNPSDVNLENWIFNQNTTPANFITPQLKAHPLGQPADNQNSVNVPAYAWMQLVVPANAVSMSFNYMIQGDWQSDSLAAAFNGTNVLLIAGNVIQTNVTFSSGSIDVSAFAGKTNEFFIGIVGGTSTNAQLTVENLAFTISVPPSLQAQMSGGNLMLSWPMSSQNFSLQTTTNLADPISWMTLPNVPAIVNLQNAVTNPISDGMRFYRLKQ
jgi:hypothetical protein